MQQAKAAVGIIAWPLASPVENTASKESPAPATSRRIHGQGRESLVADQAIEVTVVGDESFRAQLHNEAFDYWLSEAGAGSVVRGRCLCLEGQSCFSFIRAEQGELFEAGD